MTQDQLDKIEDLIRADICQIVKTEEVEELIHEGILKSWHDRTTIEDLASKILPHRCTPRCLKRTGPGNGPENFTCRKINNFRINPDPTRDYYLPLNRKFLPETVNRLIKIGMMEEITVNEFGWESEIKSSHPYFHPTRHIPWINANGNRNISPVETKTFCVCKTQQIYKK